LKQSWPREQPNPFWNTIKCDAALIRPKLDAMRVMMERHSSRVAFDPKRPVARQSLDAIVEAARWAPTPHNMQNFEVVAVDDPSLIGKLGRITSRISRDFLMENFRQLSFSKEELQRKGVGILGTNFPPSWRDASRLEAAARDRTRTPLSESLNGSPALLIVLYDPSTRAPASEGDFLGVIGLGCVMENMWLAAQSLGIGFQVLSVFGGAAVQTQVKRILGIPRRLRIAFAIRLGYPLRGPSGYLRVRREPTAFYHRNGYGKSG